MEIVDAQIHLNQLVPDWETADLDTAIKTRILTMDAVGVGAVLIAELKANCNCMIGKGDRGCSCTSEP